MYSLIVIGDDLASHVAAALNAHRGNPTALIAENGIGGTSYIGDLAFETDPTPLCGLGENQSLFSLFRELRISPEFHLLDPAYQIILPQKRIDFFPGKEALVNELCREFPHLSKSIKTFYDNVEIISDAADKWLRNHPNIQPKYFRELIEYIKFTPCLIKSFINNLRMNRLMRQDVAFKKVAEAQQVLLSPRKNRQHPFFSFFQLFVPVRGVYHFAQGKQVLFDALIQKIESSKGLYQTRCEILAVEKRKDAFEVTYMDKSGNPARIEGDNLIVSVKWQNMRLLTGRKKRLNVGDFFRPARITHYPFTIHLGITPGCIPEKMGKYVAVISDLQKDIYDDNLILLNSPASASVRTDDVHSKIPLSATVFLPDHPDKWSRDSLELTAHAIIERLDSFLPFLKENIVFFDINESIAHSQKQRDVVNAKYEMRDAFMTGFGARSNKTRFNNVYLTGAPLLPDTGFEGEIISGMNAAGRLSSNENRS